MALRERELQDELVIYLTEQGFNCREYVYCSVGIADLVIDNAVIELKDMPNRDALFRGIGQAILYRGAIDKSLDAKIICSYCGKKELSKLAATALAISQSGLELIPWMAGKPLVFAPDTNWKVANTFETGDICSISSLCNSKLLKYNQSRAVVTEVFDYECFVVLRGEEILIPCQHLKRVEILKTALPLSAKAGQNQSKNQGGFRAN
jgi:hypothetical protein